MYNSGNFNGKNRWIIKKVSVLKKLLPHLATRGTYSPGDWRCDEAWREQTLVHPPVMCQQRLSYCTWELNVMWWPARPGFEIGRLHASRLDMPAHKTTELLRILKLTTLNVIRWPVPLWWASIPPLRRYCRIFFTSGLWRSILNFYGSMSPRTRVL